MECCGCSANVCDDCPITTALKDDCKCGEYLATNALDLINRLQAEKEALINGQETLQKYIAEQKAEIERLEKENEEQYEIARDTIRAEIADGGTSCRWCEDTIRGVAKAEAYKECIKKVKEEIKQALESNYKARNEREKKEINLYLDDLFWNYCSGKIDCLRGLDDFLDELLKELVGDNDAR